MRTRRDKRIRRRGCYIQLPGLATGGLLDRMGGKVTPGDYELPTKLAAVNGAEFHYFELGEGEPAIFVHGSIGDYRTWGYQFEAFSERHRMISYSRRFYHPNKWTSDGSDINIAAHAADLAAFAQAVNATPAHIIGQSSGADTVITCAHLHPEIFRTLTIIEPSIVPWLPQLPGGQETLDAWVSEVIEPSKRAMDRGDERDSVEIMCDGVLGSGTWDSLSDEMRQVMLDNAPAWRAELDYAATINSQFSFDDARQIAIPTLLVRGGSTLRLFDIVSEKLIACIPHMEMAVIPGAPHATHFVTPEQFNATVLDFLARNRSKPS